MKLCVVFVLIKIIASLSTRRVESSMFEAIVQLSNSFSHMTIVAATSDTAILERALQSLYKLSDRKLVRVVTYHPRLNSERLELSDSAILLFDNIQSVKTFNKKALLVNKFPKQFQFFVILKNVTHSEISSLEDSEILHFQYFLLEDTFSIKLLTYVWYTPEKCATPQLKEVNKFNGKTRKWKLGKFSLIKNSNFNGCELVFGAHRQRPAFEFEIQPERKLSYTGFHYNMIRNIANALNFSLTFNPISRYGGAPLFKNLSIDISMQLAPLNFYILFTDIHSFTYPYMYYYDFILVPPGEDYTEYEKLFLPFDIWVWYLIVFTFAVSFITIFTLNLTEPDVKYFVYGRNIQTPSFLCRYSSAFHKS